MTSILTKNVKERRIFMVGACALIAFFVGFIPGGSFILIPMEMFLLWKIADDHGKFDFAKWLGMGAALWTLSLFLIGFASMLHIIPIIGQFANAIVAGGTVFLVGKLAEKTYSS